MLGKQINLKECIWYYRAMTQARFRLFFVLMLIALLLLLGIFGTRLNPALLFKQQEIISGQWWRLLTGHIVHLGIVHTLLNLAGFGLVLNLVGDQRKILSWCLAFLLIALGTSAAMLIWNPKVSYYAGLSGVLHGLLVFGLVPLCKQHKLIGWGGLLIIVVKLCYEQLVTGSSSQTAELIGANVVSIAHVYGAVLGLILAFLFFATNKILTNR